MATACLFGGGSGVCCSCGQIWSTTAVTCDSGKSSDTSDLLRSASDAAVSASATMRSTRLAELNPKALSTARLTLDHSDIEDFNIYISNT